MVTNAMIQIAAETTCVHKTVWYFHTISLRQIQTCIQAQK